jgi:hypothetical protein
MQAWQKYPRNNNKTPETPTHSISRASTDVSAETSSDGSPSGLFTPPKKRTLTDLFQSDDCPSPPRLNDMEVDEANERMRALLIWPFTPELLEATYPENHKKLCYLIGHGLDLLFPYGKRTWTVIQLLKENSELGERFQALYNAKGDTLQSQEDIPENKTFQYYIDHHLKDYKNESESKGFTIFDCPMHTNMEVFYRFQISGNCFIQAPILMIWYLTLWYDATKVAMSVPLIHLSRYVRNKMTGQTLFNYIFKDDGGESQDVLEAIIYNPSIQKIAYDDSFHKILENLQKFGPALVTVDDLPKTDFGRNGKFCYDEYPKEIGETAGHAMLLVGIRQDKNNQTFFLLQNWWPEKEFVELRQDYLTRMAGSRHSFSFITKAVSTPSDANLYTQATTGNVRSSQSSPALERAYHRRVPGESLFGSPSK